MEVSLDLPTGSGAHLLPLEDTFISIRFGKERKQGRFTGSRTVTFSAAAGRERLCRLDVFRRLGSSYVQLNGGDSEVASVDVPNGGPEVPRITWRLSVKRCTAEATPRSHQQRDAAHQYWTKHQLDVELVDVVKQLLRDKPDNPRAFLTSRMKAQSKTLQSFGTDGDLSSCDDGGNPPQPPLTVLASAFHSDLTTAREGLRPPSQELPFPVSQVVDEVFSALPRPVSRGESRGTGLASSALGRPGSRNSRATGAARGALSRAASSTWATSRTRERSADLKAVEVGWPTLPEDLVQDQPEKASTEKLLPTELTEPGVGDDNSRPLLEIHEKGAVPQEPLPGEPSLAATELAVEEVQSEVTDGPAESPSETQLGPDGRGAMKETREGQLSSCCTLVRCAPGEEAELAPSEPSDAAEELAIEEPEGAAGNSAAAAFQDAVEAASEVVPSEPTSQSAELGGESPDLQLQADICGVRAQEREEVASEAEALPGETTDLVVKEHSERQLRSSACGGAKAQGNEKEAASEVNPSEPAEISFEDSAELKLRPGLCGGGPSGNEKEVDSELNPSEPSEFSIEDRPEWQPRSGGCRGPEPQGHKKEAFSEQPLSELTELLVVGESPEGHFRPAACRGAASSERAGLSAEENGNWHLRPGVCSGAQAPSEALLSSEPTENGVEEKPRWAAPRLGSLTVEPAHADPPETPAKAVAPPAFTAAAPHQAPPFCRELAEALLRQAYLSGAETGEPEVALPASADTPQQGRQTAEATAGPFEIHVQAASAPATPEAPRLASPVYRRLADALLAQNDLCGADSSEIQDGPEEVHARSGRSALAFRALHGPPPPLELPASTASATELASPVLQRIYDVAGSRAADLQRALKKASASSASETLILVREFARTEPPDKTGEGAARVPARADEVTVLPRSVAAAAELAPPASVSVSEPSILVTGPTLAELPGEREAPPPSIILVAEPTSMEPPGEQEAPPPSIILVAEPTSLEPPGEREAPLPSIVSASDPSILAAEPAPTQPALGREALTASGVAAAEPAFPAVVIVDPSSCAEPLEVQAPEGGRSAAVRGTPAASPGTLTVPASPPVFTAGAAKRASPALELNYLELFVGTVSAQGDIPAGRLNSQREVLEQALGADAELASLVANPTYAAFDTAHACGDLLAAEVAAGQELPEEVSVEPRRGSVASTDADASDLIQVSADAAAFHEETRDLAATWTSFEGSGAGSTTREGSPLAIREPRPTLKRVGSDEFLPVEDSVSTFHAVKMTDEDGEWPYEDCTFQVPLDLDMNVSRCTSKGTSQPHSPWMAGGRLWSRRASREEVLLLQAGMWGVGAEHMVSQRRASGTSTPLAMIRLRVTISQAVHLSNADWRDLTDPYCIMEVYGKEPRTFRTQVVVDDEDPTWESYEFDYPLPHSLHFKVYDKDCKKGESLGKVKLTHDRFWPHGFSGHVNLLEECQKEGKEALLFLKVEPLYFLDQDCMEVPLTSSSEHSSNSSNVNEEEEV